jgi:hypothetical protein
VVLYFILVIKDFFFEIASGTLCDGLYKLDLDLNYPFSHNVFATIGSKRVNDEFSSMLWHKHLGHITRDRMERLIRNGIQDSLDFAYFQSILDSLDFSKFQTCVDCVQGKITRARKKGASRNKGLLEIIHTNICGPFTPAILGEYKYFITFVDDFSRYGYIFLIHEKSKD